MCKYCEREDRLEDFCSEDICDESVPFLGVHMLLRVVIGYRPDDDWKPMYPTLGIYSGIKECSEDFIHEEIPIRYCPMCGRKLTNEIES